MVSWLGWVLSVEEQSGRFDVAVFRGLIQERSSVKRDADP
jgi:hypothetical protein